jgi:hypothetical protein
MNDRFDFNRGFSSGFDTKTILPTSHFLMILISQVFFTFATPKTASEQENKYKKKRFESRILGTHHSTIPLFHCSIAPVGAANHPEQFL